MPLIQSRSKKAFSKNIETEMEHGKPQNQSIAIAFATKRKNSGKKKMAEGGAISASDEKRPMPDNTYNDSKTTSKNSGDKAPKNDSWTGQPTVAQAQSNNGRMVKPIKRPSMVPSNGFSTRLYNEEGMLEESAKPGPYGAQPNKLNDEEGANRQGPKVSDMEDEHSTKRKPYAKGGEVESSDYKASPNKYEDDLTDLPPSEDEGTMMADSHNEAMADSENPNSLDMEPEHSNGRKPYAAGGEATQRAETLDSQEPITEHGYSSDEEALGHAASIVAAVMAKRKMMANGGILSHDSIYSDDSDQADISRNADEDANEEDQTSFNALRKENYSESEGLAQLDSPMDSNEDGRTIDHDKHDMLDDIRKKMKRRLK